MASSTAKSVPLTEWTADGGQWTVLRIIIAAVRVFDEVKEKA
jgi:hypothetical protein